MRNQPSTAETPMAMTIPIGPDMAALCVSSVIYMEKRSAGDRRAQAPSDLRAH